MTETVASPSVNKDTARRFLEDVLNKRDFREARAYFSPDATDSFTGVLTTCLTLASFPDFQLSLEHVVAEDDTVTVLATYTGTHERALMGLEPTREGVTGRVAFSFRMSDGKIAETWAEIEPWGLLQQLGAPGFAPGSVPGGAVPEFAPESAPGLAPEFASEPGQEAGR